MIIAKYDMPKNISSEVSTFPLSLIESHNLEVGTLISNRPQCSHCLCFPEKWGEGLKKGGRRLWGNKISNLYSAGEELRKDSGALSFPSLRRIESMILI